MERIRPDIERFAQQFGDFSSGAESARDLAQDAALRFWERFLQFRGAADDESTAAMLHNWVEKLIRRLAANRHEARHAGKRRPDLPLLRLEALAGIDSLGAPLGLDPAGNGPTPSAVVGAAEVDARVHAALQRIPDSTDRQILELCFVQALSLRTVAEQLNLSDDKVRERYHTALRFLESELESLL